MFSLVRFFCWHKAHVLRTSLWAQVLDCSISLWTVSVRWVRSGCWAWCLMCSRVRTWEKKHLNTLSAIIYIIHYTSGVKSEMNSQRSVFHSVHVCGWGSTGWRPADSACCSSGRREPGERWTERRPWCSDGARTAARGKQEGHTETVQAPRLVVWL